MRKTASKNVPPNTANPSLMVQIASLETLRTAELKALWQTLYDQPPTVIHRRFLQRRLAYRLQELASRETEAALLARNRRRIEQLVDTGSVAKRQRHRGPMAGTVFTRDYAGRLHRVVALADGGFDYEGRRYRSLSVIAREITGTRWSGPAFFGLRGSASAKKEGA